MPKNNSQAKIDNSLKKLEPKSSTRLKDEDFQYVKSKVSEEFDVEFYVKHVSLEDSEEPLEHFLLVGWHAGYDPCEWFSVNAYLELNPDIKMSNLNPFFHYLEMGRSENRPIRDSQLKHLDTSLTLSHAKQLIGEEFDEEFYRSEYSISENTDAIEHYLKVGWKIGHNPNLWFSTNKYLESNSDVAQSNAEPFCHFLTYGLAEKRPLYSTPLYKTAPSLLSPSEAFAEFKSSYISEVADTLRRCEKTINAHWKNWTSKLKTVEGSPEFIRANLEFAVCFANGKEGALLGWMIGEGEPVIWAEDSNGNMWFVENAYRIKRADVHQAFLKSPFNSISENLGILLRLPGIAQNGSLTLKALSHQGVHILGKVDIENIGSNPVQAAHWLFGIPSSETLLSQRFSEFDLPIMESIIANQRKLEESLPNSVKEYGKPIEQPEVSIIIPLYGRLDFIESQLLCFSEDDYILRQTELIFVIDDPLLVSDFAKLAEQLFNLYQIPFKSIWGGTNRGFSGANNIGAKHANGELLLFLNSDVFPKQNGWLETLIHELTLSNDIGVVAPRLTFADGSLQHAGMEFKFRSDLGIWINHHPQMGLTAELDANKSPTEFPAVTGACMLIRRGDFDSIEGWDTGYLIGDFEDSDLCLKLHNIGKKCVYVPNVELTHLERQSFNLTGQSDFRMKVVIFNAVRHQTRWGRIIQEKSI